MPTTTASAVSIRHGLRPGDLGMIVHLHGRIYAAEHGLDTSFEPYVARPLADFALAGPQAGRIWLAEPAGEDRLLGSVAMVRGDDSEAQLRWFLLVPEARGLRLGRRLLDLALAHAREQAYANVHLWTFADLAAAIHLYEASGFRVTERRTSFIWGRERTELRMDRRSG